MIILESDLAKKLRNEAMKMSTDARVLCNIDVYTCVLLKDVMPKGYRDKVCTRMHHYEKGFLDEVSQDESYTLAARRAAFLSVGCESAFVHRISKTSNGHDMQIFVKARRHWLLYLAKNFNF